MWSLKNIYGSIGKGLTVRAVDKHEHTWQQRWKSVEFTFFVCALRCTHAQHNCNERRLGTSRSNNSQPTNTTNKHPFIHKAPPRPNPHHVTQPPAPSHATTPVSPPKPPPTAGTSFFPNAYSRSGPHQQNIQKWTEKAGEIALGNGLLSYASSKNVRRGCSVSKTLKGSFPS